ncbi:C-type lectin domain family 4 member E-like [Carassius gibelio]|uniref:C-type lectin domain family 4 member E-like n=1 Tax=Carassius gibelio TaxID=101364 RepID=UPI002278B3BD|nr:C-type lectin domain family 4 member E-like [Carassius gibelio]
MSHDVDSVYENSSFILQTVASGEKCSRYKGNSTEEQESVREVCLPKRTKVLRMVFAVCLVFALGGLCILGILCCAVHWIHSGGKCYYFSTVKMNWTRSRDHCVTLGGHLVIINSKAEQDFVTSNVEETHWIGLNDLETEGNWVWVNNQPVNDSVKFWMERKDDISEPDNWSEDDPDGEDCAGLGDPAGGTDFWMDAYCFKRKRFVCEAVAAV